MKRGLIYLLIAIVLAGWLGTLIVRDPGYVLLSYDGTTLQTGLWVFLAIIAFAMTVIYYAIRLGSLVMRTSGYFRQWRGDRSKSKSELLTTRGLTLFEEGQYDRAEQFLAGGASGQSAALNFIYAAKAANKQGDAESRESYLRKALEADAASRNAISVASAGMAIERGDHQRALSELKDVKVNAEVHRLKSKALFAMQDWQGLADLMPQLKGAMSSGELQDLQYQIARARLSAPEVTDDALAIIFKKLPDVMRNDPGIVGLYCSRLGNEKEAEVAIRNCLKHAWDAGLLAQYGGLGTQTLARRIKTAEAFLKQHPDDPALQLCLGRLYEAQGDKTKARTAYQKAVDLGNSPTANAHLGRLLAFDGDYKKGNEYLSQALRLEGLSE